jgi:hypothetical protein
MCILIYYIEFNAILAPNEINLCFTFLWDQRVDSLTWKFAVCYYESLNNFVIRPLLGTYSLLEWGNIYCSTPDEKLRF